MQTSSVVFWNYIKKKLLLVVGFELGIYIFSNKNMGICFLTIWPELTEDKFFLRKYVGQGQNRKEGAE